MWKKTRFFLAITALLACVEALATPQGWQDLSALKKVAEVYARAETSQYPGKVTITIGSIDNRLRLPACPAPEAFTPAGARLWGNSTLGIRCAAPGWNISVPLKVSVMADIVTAARPLQRHRMIEAGDLSLRQADLTQLAPGTLTDAAQVVGQQLVIGISSGASFKTGMLRAPLIILQGQKVRLVTQGPGFTVNGEGKALTNGSLGQSISIRTSSGKLVSGKVKAAGLVEIAH